MNPGYHRSTMKRAGSGSSDPKVYCRGCPVLHTGFFSALNGPAKSTVVCLMEYGHYIPHQILFQEGNPAIRIFAIKSGYVKTYRTHPQGKHQVIQVAKGGDVLNLESIQGGQCAVTAEVLAKSEICFLEVQRLLDLAKRNSLLALEIIRMMSSVIVESQQRILDFGTKDAKSRFAGFLLDMIPDAGGKKDSVEFRLPLTRHEIADLIGVRLETISRLFQVFKEQKIVATESRSVRVLDIPKLKELAR